MCLIFLSFNQHPKYPFIVVANRDEFYERPAEPIHHWPENKEIIAGKDLSGGGTWLGVTSTGHFAMLTNYRDMHNIKPNAPTRGKLVSDFLISKYDVSLILPFALLNPVFAIVAAMIILDEAMTPVRIAGAVLTLIGVAVVQLRGRQRQLPES